MSLITRSGPPDSGWFSGYYLIFILFSSMLLCGSPFAAHAAEPVSFSWQANPAEDYVMGYRLYYGLTSRFDYTGKPKVGFSYDYYVDLNDLERCVAGGTGANCTVLSSNEVTCQNLTGDSPRCTLYNLQGQLYFAMTAYNAQAESNYTQELRVFLGGNLRPVTPEVLAALQQINVLLLDKKK